MRYILVTLISTSYVYEIVGLDAADEALAYAVANQDLRWDVIQGDVSVFRPLFEFFRASVDEHGIRETIAKAKAAIEEAWAETKHVAYVLGVKV